MNERNEKIIARLVYEMELRNYSNASITTYGKLLEKMASYFNINLDTITSEQLKQYLHYRLKEDEISVSTINQTISMFKILQTDVLKREWEQIKIKRPRREQKLPVVLSVDEVENLIQSTKNIKHRVLLMLAYSTGMRRQEIQMIKPSAIDSSRMLVHVVQGKGKKDRYTILSPKVLEALRIYYKLEKPTCYLFESQGKKGVHLADQTLNSIIQNSAKKAAIKKHISFHTLRHSFATHLLEQGVNLKLIQQLMGHNSIRTTSIYLHLSNVNPASIISPLEKMDL